MPYNAGKECWKIMNIPDINTSCYYAIAVAQEEQRGKVFKKPSYPLHIFYTLRFSGQGT